MINNSSPLRACLLKRTSKMTVNHMNLLNHHVVPKAIVKNNYIYYLRYKPSVHLIQSVQGFFKNRLFTWFIWFKDFLKNSLFSCFSMFAKKYGEWRTEKKTLKKTVYKKSKEKTPEKETRQSKLEVIE